MDQTEQSLFTMTSSRNSSSSHRTDQSATACNPNTSQTTPTSQKLPSKASSRSSISSSSNGGDDEEQYDVKKDLDNPVEGWPRVALLMAKTPDFAAFSRFRDLNVKSLLYYQAQLTVLRKKLHEQEYDDSRNTDEDEDTGQFASRADFLMTSEESKQLILVNEIRRLLKEYSKCNSIDFSANHLTAL